MKRTEAGQISRSRKPLPPPHGASKAELRKWARATRSRLRAELGTAVDDAVCAALLGSAAFQAASTVALYLPLDDEVNVLGLAKPPKRFVAPRMLAPAALGLTFHELNLGALEVHAWGVRQPAAGTREVPLHEIDVVLVPGLLFDVTGARLGFGKGYYDRVLAPPSSGNGEPRPVAIGVAYEALVVPELPVATHDVAVDLLVTEAGLREVAR